MFSALQFSWVKYILVRLGSFPYSVDLYDEVKYSAVMVDIVQFSAAQCSRVKKSSVKFSLGECFVHLIAS